MDPVKYRNAKGEERLVTSVERGIAAEFDGFYPPNSPSAKAFSAAKAAETRKTNAKKTPAKRGSRRTASAPEGPTTGQVATGAAEPATAAQAASAASSPAR